MCEHDNLNAFSFFVFSKTGDTERRKAICAVHYYFLRRHERIKIGHTVHRAAVRINDIVYIGMKMTGCTCTSAKNNTVLQFNKDDYFFVSESFKLL